MVTLVTEVRVGESGTFVAVYLLSDGRESFKRSISKFETRTQNNVLQMTSIPTEDETKRKHTTESVFH